ncbi:MAG TPA: hypothetical protein VFM63_07665 [Pyrinomonadaceae bacterium]|nr:hypothetical protein [Pyrinomonadaceae bacterium]
MFSDWTRSEILNLIALPFVAIATFANAAALQSAFLRRLLVSASVVVSILTTGAVLWLGQPEKKVVTPPRRPAPTRKVPKKEVAAPTPEPTPVPVPASFIVEPSDPHAWRSAYCLVADFEGSLVPNADKIDAAITSANFDLCRFSKHGSRQIRIRVGVEISGRPLRWSPRTTVARLEPGHSYSLEKPLNLSIPTRVRDLSRAVVLVEVENLAIDTGKRNRYVLRSPTDVATR